MPRSSAALTQYPRSSVSLKTRAASASSAANPAEMDCRNGSVGRVDLNVCSRKLCRQCTDDPLVAFGSEVSLEGLDPRGFMGLFEAPGGLFPSQREISFQRIELRRRGGLRGYDVGATSL